MSNIPLLVFSDLDGTLLDHDTYSWAAAKPALSALAKIGAGLILASSKTAAEMQVVQADVGVSQWPAIVENGAGLLGKRAPQMTDYNSIRTALFTAPFKGQFQGFGDMTVTDVTDATGLSPDDAERAKARAFSEPGIWHGTTTQRTHFLTHLAARGITAREGGRFLTLSMGKTKADQMTAIIKRYKPVQTMALGDAPNDIEMLQAADHGVIIANPHRTALPTLPEEASGKIIRTKKPGPAGWNDAVLARISHLRTAQNGSRHG
jgi:mannosyl-3-phosphoglycerate phosphatase